MHACSRIKELDHILREKECYDWLDRYKIMVPRIFLCQV